MNKVIIFVVSICLGAGGIFFLTRPLETVGDIKITKKDVKYRDQIIKLEFPEEKRSLGLLQLEKSALNYMVLKNNGYVINDAQVEEEEKRIDRSTKNPEQLAKIKEIFKGDMDSYRRVFIFPALVNRTIYGEFFIKDDRIHADTLSTAAKLIEETAPKPQTFAEVAGKKNLPVRKVSVSVKEGIQWDVSQGAKGKLDEPGKLPAMLKVKEAETQNPELYKKVQQALNLGEGGSSSEAQEFIDSILSGLKPGEVAPVPINRGQSWMVVRFLNKAKGDKYLAEVVEIPKIEYGLWLESEIKKVPIKKGIF